MKQNTHSIVLITIVSLGVSGCTNSLELLLPSVHTQQRGYQKKRVVQKKRVIQQKTEVQTEPNTTKHEPKKYEKPTPEKNAKFNEIMREVALSTQDDGNYRKIALDTPEKKAWFKNLMYRLWDKQITKDQFISEGLTKYPTRTYEFTFIANGFQKRS